VKKKSLFLSLLLSMFLCGFSSAGQADWTEKKLGKVIIKAERAAIKKKWSRGIKYGKRMVSGSLALDTKKSIRYIHLLKNINSYYDKAGRLLEVGGQVKKTYFLSSQNLGLDHPTTIKSRNLYYKILILNNQYSDAIPLMLEKILMSRKKPESEYKTLQYLSKLHSLYALIGQYEKEEDILLIILELNRKLVGTKDESNSEIIMNLANNYCRQKKFGKFDQLVTAHNLKLVC